MKFGPKPFGAMRLVVKGNASEYTVERVTRTVGSMGDAQESSTTHTANIWVYNENELTLNIDIGERIDGETQGLALVEEDIAINDRIQYGSDTFEISAIVVIPTENTPKLQLLELDKRTND